MANNARRFTVDEVLETLRRAAPDAWGREIAFPPEALLCEEMFPPARSSKASWLTLSVEDDDGIDEVMIEELGLALDLEVLCKFLRSRRREDMDDDTLLKSVTCREFAEYVAATACKVSFEPLEILGNRCAAAGAFRAIEEVARRQIGRDKRIAPSTSIYAHFQGVGLLRFWRELAVHRAELLPGLRAPGSTFLRTTRILGIALLVLSPVLLIAEAFYAMLYSVAAGRASYQISAALLGLLTRLPADVLTFGDLARALADPEPA